jgi:serine phosphatase RsbU (regulator of sigma subunit)
MSVRSIRVLIVAGAVALLIAIAELDVPFVSGCATAVVALATVAFVLWLLWRGFRAFLWRVGRRLAFSYFLLGVLPIPLLAVLAAVAAYLLSGFFLGHLYRDAVRGLQAELAVQARERLVDFTARRSTPETSGEAAFAYYRDARRVAGDSRAPAVWPVWVASRTPVSGAREASPALYTLPDGSPTLAATAAADDRGVLAFVPEVDQGLRRRCAFWVEVTVPEPGEEDVVNVEVRGKRIPLQLSFEGQRTGEAKRFFGQPSAAAGWRERPLLWWGETSGALVDLTTGRTRRRYATATLNATPLAVQRHLVSSSAEIDAAAWAVLLAVGALLLNVYAIAAVMAIVMIVGLSRAVNRLSRATAAVRAGDFSLRIPVRRRDQVGELQRSFNLMAQDLETLVATAAQKEALEKELAIARELQQSLIPHDLPSREGVEFASLFEPSAAIGGDYFDVLSFGERQIAVVIADVSGHGLSSGLRMAMIKAALHILVLEQKDPAEILGHLDSLVRSDPAGRVFVTATFARVDLAAGTLEITNAGHPPTYLLRGGQVEEILLPSSPLGGLGHSYGRRTVSLERGDVVVWLSDGLIEAAAADGAPFGYERVAAALAASPEGAKRGQPDGAEGAYVDSAQVVRNRLLAAVERHSGGQPVQDDRTLVVMRYGGEAAGAEAAAPSAAA